MRQSLVILEAEHLFASTICEKFCPRQVSAAVCH